MATSWSDPVSKEGWSDVTELLGSAAAEMSLGEMVHGESFSLFEAMSALELMDPKMDSGMQSARVVPVLERVRSGALCFEPWPRESLDAAHVVRVVRIGLRDAQSFKHSLQSTVSHGRLNVRKRLGARWHTLHVGAENMYRASNGALLAPTRPPEAARR